MKLIIDCTGYGQSDRFMKTVQKLSDHIGQEYKGGGITRTEVMTQTGVIIQEPTMPIGVSIMSDNGITTSIIPPDVLDISDYQSANKIVTGTRAFKRECINHSLQYSSRV
jgi:hypothetical protein